MNRLVISVDGSGNNAGAQCIPTISGRVTMVQFSLAIDDAASKAQTIQVCTQPTFTSSINDSCLNPTEIASITMQIIRVTTATEAVAALASFQCMIPADFAISPGMQLFVNISSGGVATAGFVTLYVS